jgi:hypothetical protein
MKLFILNKKEFEDTFENNEITNKVHKRAFKELETQINSECSIPLFLTPHYSDEGMVLFEFYNKKDDVYFYKFNSTMI